MTPHGEIEQLDAIMLDIVGSYPLALRRWVDVATVTRVFARELMSTLVDEVASPHTDEDGDLWEQLVALPFVERRPNETYALHETARRPLLADLRVRDRELVQKVASSAYDFFIDRVESSVEDWSPDLLEVAYYGLLTDPEIEMDEVDACCRNPRSARTRLGGRR